MLHTCLQQMSTADFRDNPDRRLNLYSSVSNLECDKTRPMSDYWVAVMLKATQDPWSRIRQLGRETLLRGMTTLAIPSKEEYVYKILGLLLCKWLRLKHWYEREGLILLLLGLVSRTPAVISEITVLAHLLMRIVLPSLSDSQISVREGAVNIMLYTAPMNKELAAFTRDYVFARLKERINMSAEREACEVEGLLTCIARLVAEHTSLIHTEWWDRLQPLLKQLAVHSAASVRQRVAEVWSLRAEEFFESLLIEIVQKGEAPSDGDEWWRMVEVLLIVLQELLTRYLSLSKKTRIVEMNARGGLIANSLCAVLFFAELQRFETARMGRQLIPLLTQFWVRFAPSLTFLNDCCGQLAGRFRERIHFSTLFLPELIWFLALRRYVDSFEYAKGVQNAIKQYVMPLVSGTWDVSSNSHEVVKFSSCPGYPLAVILLYTYFPECFAECADRNLKDFALSKPAWDSALAEDVNNIKYAVDFAISVRRGRGTVMHLVPVWLQWLPDAYAHQQCLILEAVKIAIGTPEHWVSERPFSFAYHSTFDAPTMQEGGEDVSRGFHWLKRHCPSEASLPVMASAALGLSVCDEKIPATLHEVVYKTVYTSKGAEPSTLHSVRSLMLMECEAYPNVDTIAVLVESIISRLENVAPSWQSVVACSTQKGSNTSNAVVWHTKHGNVDYHDWDDSDDDFQVECLTPEKEVKEARCLLAAISNTLSRERKIEFLQAIRHADLQKKIIFLMDTS